MTSLLAFSLTLVVTASAAAATPGLLYQVPTDELAGSAAGQLREPEGVAADPTTGHVYVADSGNHRVVEFGPWGEFLKAWGWGVSNGAPQLQTCGPDAVPPTATCLSGIAGAGVGQFERVKGGIEVDSNGDVWVGDLANHRIEKFGPDGEFMLMIGGQVDQGPNNPGNLCTAAFITSGDTCGAGVAGSGSSEFESVASVGTSLTAGAPGAMVVGDKGRLEEFALDGSFLSQIILEAPHASDFVKAIDRNADGTFYLLLAPEEGSLGEKAIRKVNASGAVVSSIPVPWKPSAITVDSGGNLFVAMREDAVGSGEDAEVIEFGPAGEPLIPFEQGFATARAVASGTHNLSGLASNVVTAGGESDIYLTENGAAGIARPAAASLSAYGAPPDLWPPPLVAPEITAQYATSVTETTAVLGAEINPRFWPDATYSMEFGTGKCSEGGCPQVLPVPPAALGAARVNKPVPTAGVELTGLVPNTVYHFRFQAQSSGGGPVKGVGPGEAEATFVTPLPFVQNESCLNQSFRFGDAAQLADCRGYEMVSPVDKSGADIYPLININSNLATLNQSTPDGAKLGYTDFQAFGDAAGAPYVSQYIATRTGDGWQTHDVTAPQGTSFLAPGKRLDLNIWKFTPDLCFAALVHLTEIALAPGAIPGFRNAYRRQNCGTEGYQTLSAPIPPETSRDFYQVVPQGMSDDGRCVVLAQFEFGGFGPPPSAFNSETGSLYNWCAGQQLPVSVLPDGTPADEARVGTINGSTDLKLKLRTGNVATAVSSDGTTIYWSAMVATGGTTKRRLFVRVNADQEQSALSGTACTQKQKACTKVVSQAVAGVSARFLAASADGAVAYFLISDAESPLAGNVYEFTLANGKATKLAGDFVGDIGANADGSRFAFVSSEDLTSTPNSAGDAAEAGKPNLYYYDSSRTGGDRLHFVGILSTGDANAGNVPVHLTPIANEPYRQVSRITAAGTHVVFMSSASLTGYDNRDLSSGERDAEIYLYDASARGGAGQSVCVSCNPSGQRPNGRQLKIEGVLSNWAAARIPAFATEFYGSRVVSDDGDRVYFNSYEPLVGADTNGKADVYQWQAVGAGECTVGGPGYSAVNEGCISLISSGRSPSDSEFLDASGSGSDVFFLTNQSLLPQDPGQFDIYDAREGGGFQPAPGQPAACQGDGCQTGQTPPGSSAPGTSGSRAGNPKNPRPTCAKGRKAIKKHGKWRCVKKSQKQQAGKKQKGKRGGKQNGKKGARR